LEALKFETQRKWILEALKFETQRKWIFEDYIIYINYFKKTTSEKITHKIINTKIICASKIHYLKIKILIKFICPLLIKRLLKY